MADRQSFQFALACRSVAIVNWQMLLMQFIWVVRRLRRSTGSLGPSTKTPYLLAPCQGVVIDGRWASKSA
jgi:hypothetical protein